MPAIKIKINKVNNLTDARYFAAMGADYLGFCCNLETERYCSPTRIKEITDWVEGPQFVLELDGWQSSEEIDTLLDFNLGQALHFGAFATYEDQFSLPVFKDIIFENMEQTNISNIDFPVVRSEKNYDSFTENEIDRLKQWISGKNVFLDIPVDGEMLRKMIETLPVYGLILRGGEEEKTGLKSFENLDVIFDILHEYNAE